VEEQGLTLKGVRLEDDRSLRNYNIKRGSVIDLITPVQMMQIFVKTEEGKKIPLEVCTVDTVFSVKQQIKKKEGIPVDQQALQFEKKNLQDNHVITSYGIVRGSTIDLVEVTPPMTISIKTSTGKKIPLEVKGDDLIQTVKKKIEAKSGMIY
jgi:hypothetical protein